jgi:serine protease Do
MRTKQLVLAILVSSSVILAILYALDHPSLYNASGPYPPDLGRAGLSFTRFSWEEQYLGGPPSNFIAASHSAVEATVHITIQNHNDSNPPESFTQPGSGSGSGVLISPDGYLITNYHVVERAGQIKVTLSNKRVFLARLVGADAASDLAVLKIDSKGLPFLLYGDSEELKPGQWVLAIGYPLDLETTVTAGIVSTKKSVQDFPGGTHDKGLRSFIQTDAVINHGNSGGPLVNIEGRLVGINSYFASLTGAYTGYSFAIPVNTVKKVVNDLMNRPS